MWTGYGFSVTVSLVDKLFMSEELTKRESQTNANNDVQEVWLHRDMDDGGQQCQWMGSGFIVEKYCSKI